MLREAYDLVGGMVDTLIPLNVRPVPAGRLPFVWNNNAKGNVAARFPVRKNRFGGKRIKSFRAARVETPDSTFIQTFND